MSAALLFVTLAAAMPQVTVESHRGLYTVHIDAEVALPRDEVWALLTDYDGLARLADGIRESRLVERRPDGVAVVDTLTRSCQGPFCRTLKHRQAMTETAPERIDAVTVPEHSDFSEGRTVWELHESGTGTRLTLRMRIRPDIWVPPLVGPPFVRRALTREAGAIIDGIRRVAGQGE